MIWGSYDDMGGMGHIPASLPQLREKAQAVKKAEDVVKQARVIMGIWGSRRFPDGLSPRNRPSLTVSASPLGPDGPLYLCERACG